MSSSLDGSVYSEEGGLGMGEEEPEEDLQFQLSERIDQLGDKRYVNVCVFILQSSVCVCVCVGVCARV